MPSITTPTDGTAGRRLDFWRDVVSRSFVPLEAVPRECPDFHAELRTARVGPVQVSVVTAEAHGVARTRRLIESGAPDVVKVSLMLAGQCVITQGDRQAELGPGELAVYDTRHPYTLDTGRRSRNLVLMFPRTMLRMPERDLKRMTATTVSCRNGLGTVVRPFLSGLARQVDELESVGTPRLAENVVDLVDTLLAEHAGAVQDPGDDGPALLTGRILAYMEQHLADPRLGPDRIAAAHRISRRYLYKLMAEQGYTVSGWLREHRLARCRRDLTDPGLAHVPISAIGGRWGFPDPAHFSHVFKAAYGISPREARATLSAPTMSA
ncbi:helix-turn-helix domain-containing protein [Streptomyces ipomoeae]|jgi:AraC-like DNA-binding protein|uniref:Transcriptional regulator, AraC family n=2 Tax=Streptomyces ipomoeae TaxID=103232 RepID=L1L6U6_9ACTN|nr:helix-turn-helix domain-containing protein [Streptomyces ipomoeae]EKX68333.1 transcriptional regulator, AraC family [Streptomyces ipomoeae 91-03]MDX2695158.1 helix-turn-helix domain-containing protein [Streptomyces ipomoeae]MDX2822846.1 helix-turn-helix domain-containing protein [Streptomyces ipomoeae]MDX2841116.1 helix-turn-helix domain-containing protein [Streptomyces ipomoeae]MDX2875596.1 helix-turn-helix domain-containing protein [Streptomyces ipomoeae]